MSERSVARVLVEMVRLDVLGDGGWEEVWAGVASFEALAQIAGCDVLVDSLEEVDAGLLVWSEVKGREVVERSAGSADDDPFSEFEELDGVAPVREIEEAVGTHQVEEGVVWQELMEGGEGLDCVIGCAVGVGCVQGGDGEAGVGETGQ